MNFFGKTALNGAASGNQKKYVQTRFFPRNIQSGMWVDGVKIPRRGYPIGLWNANVLTSDG